MRKFNVASPYFLVVALLALSAWMVPTAAQAQITTIFSDDFGGSGGPLNGTTPDITTAGEVWEAGDTFLDNGVAGTPVAAGADGQAAHLDFVPINGVVYTAEAIVTNTNPNWLAFGFLPDNPPDGVADWTVQNFAVRHSNAPGYAWMLTRNRADANNQEGFLGGGTGTPQPWNGNVVDATQPITMKIILDTTGANWTAEWFLNDVSRSGPTAFDVEGNPGIGGIGFSHERNATANSGAMIDSFSLIQETVPTLLTLFVNKLTGQTTLRNTSAESVDLNYYIIESAGGALSTSGWNSLQDQGLGAAPAADFSGNGTVDAADLTEWKGDYGLNGDSDADGDGDSDGQDFLLWQRQLGQSSGGSGGSWQEAGGADSNALAELLLEGATTLAPNQDLNLGNAFNPLTFGSGNDGDLTFSFGAAGESLRPGSVVYVTSSPVTAVPEPASLALIALSLAGLIGRKFS